MRNIFFEESCHLKLQKRFGKNFFWRVHAIWNSKYTSPMITFPIYFSNAWEGHLKYRHNYLCMYARRIDDYSFCLQKSVLPII
jgi:hypothetical protein